MRKEFIETGKTVEEAIAAGCARLGVDTGSCEFEIIDMPKKGGFLGLKSLPARVRVYIDGPDDPAPAKTPREPRPVPQKAEQKPTHPRAPKKPEMNREARQPRPEVRPQAAPGPAPEKAVQSPPSGELAAKAELAAAYLTGVMTAMGLTVEIGRQWEENGVCLDVKGEGLGAIIGRRGETLDALQYLSGLVANRGNGDYLRVTVDSGEYRTKRRATLEQLAGRMAAQVLKTNVSKILEPMNPFERRIIHATVSAIEGVSSTSVGDEPNRRVVITTPTARPPRRPRSEPRRDGRGDGGFHSRGGYRDRGPRPHEDRDENVREDGGHSRDRSDGERRGSFREGGRTGGGRDRRGGGRDVGGRGERKPATPPYQPTKEPDIMPTEAVDQPLYGKIDLE